jgi:hypothetical protein
MSEIARIEAGVVPPTLAEQINAEHRACEVAVASAVEHAIRAGEMLMEAKKQAGHGRWLPWLTENFEGSHDKAQVYMRLARKREFLLNNERARFSSIRGAVTELKREDREKRRHEQLERLDQWREKIRQGEREFIERVRGGEVWIPLQMAVSHTYDFEKRHEGVDDWSEPVLCLVEESNGIVSFIGQPDWSDGERIWELYEAFELDAGDKEFLTKLCKPPWRNHSEADLEASSRLLDDDLDFQPPIRGLSWEDERLCLPTGHLAARLVGDTPWVWWVWDSMDGAEILRYADPELVNADALGVRSFFVCELGKKRPPKWANACELEAALVEELEAVRKRLQTDKPDLTDPRTVYEIGERVLGHYEKRRPVWQRFAAFAQSRRAA